MIGGHETAEECTLDVCNNPGEPPTFNCSCPANFGGLNCSIGKQMLQLK